MNGFKQITGAFVWNTNQCFFHSVQFGKAFLIVTRSFAGFHFNDYAAIAGGKYLKRFEEFAEVQGQVVALLSGTKTLGEVAKEEEDVSASAEGPQEEPKGADEASESETA